MAFAEQTKKNAKQNRIFFPQHTKNSTNPDQSLKRILFESLGGANLSSPKNHPEKRQHTFDNKNNLLTN